jgi:acetylornithine deacetylase/succinyl-diaminopimelate desuccinylase-like protein
MGLARDPVELLRQLIRFDTSNPPGNERACMEFLADRLKEGGVETRFLSRDAERPNLVAVVPGRTKAPPLLLHGHVDVVPAKAKEWRHQPFAGELVSGEVWGRGALDMKSGVAMLVIALLRVATNLPPSAGDIILALTSDEERGSELGSKFLVDDHADLFAGARHAISEFGGSTQWIRGRPFYPIQVAEKQTCLVRATVRTSVGEWSTGSAMTVPVKLGRLLIALERRRLPVHITPIVREMVMAIAGGLSRPERIGLRTLLAAPLTDSLLAVLGPRGRLLDPLVHNEATPTAVLGRQASDVVPTEATVEITGRLLPGQTPADLVQELDDLVSGVATYEIVEAGPAASEVPDMTLFPLLSSIIRRRVPEAVPFPLLLSGHTDACHFARLGIQTYGFLPLRLPKTFPKGLIHGPDERVPAEAVGFGLECVYEAIRRYPEELRKAGNHL